MEFKLAQLVHEMTELPPSVIRVSRRVPLTYQSNCLYDIWVGDQHWIAKEYLKEDEFEASPRREYDALYKVLLLDIAPKPIRYIPHDDGQNPIVIYEYMDGNMWDRYSPTSMEMEQLAVLWRKMNSMTSDVGWISRGYGREIGEIYRRFRSNFQVYEEWVLADFRAGEQALDLCLEVFEKSRPYADELAQYDPPLLFCRADPRFANVIRRPDGRLGMVDWEDSGLRDPACDIADMMTHPNQEDLVSSEQWHVFLVNYLGGLRKHDPCIEERIRLYRAMTSVFWLGLLVKALVGRAAGDGFAGWMANDMPAQTRLRRYLARCLAYPDVDFSNQLRDIASLAFFPEPSA